MNELTSTLRSDYKPRLAIIQYKSDTSESMTYYLESHVIDDNGALLEGRPLLQDTIAGMVDVFREKHVEDARLYGAVPECLLYFNAYTPRDYQLNWYRPAQQRVLYFTPNLKLKSGLAMVPALLFSVHGGGLSVWALKTNKRPDLRTKLFAAPFHNVNAKGDVCLGSARARMAGRRTFENVIAYWEQLFWASKFSADHNATAVEGGIGKVWKQQLAKPANPFPVDLLADSKKTYKSIVNEAE